MRKGMVAFAVAVMALQMMAGNDVASLPGWSSDFHASTNLAIQSHIPLVMIWGNRGCQHCQRLEADVQNEEFSNWRESTKYRFCFVLGTLGKDPDGAKGARLFAGTAGGTHASPRSYPLVCVYWKKPDGTMSTWSFTTESAETVRMYAERYFAGYVPVLGPDEFSFVVSDTDFDRLEAEPTTPYVDVPLQRKINRGGIATNRLVVTWRDAHLPPTTNLVVWGNVETQRLVRVNLPRGDAAFAEGDKIQVLLQDESGLSKTGSIHFVSARASSVHNPKFVGEPFDFGEWTMDYEAAKRKGGYVLANFSGGLWCPDCNGIDSMLFLDARFTEWAASNRVSLVLFDQGLSTSPATAAGNGKARLLTYAAGPSYFREGRPLISGASYLSRKAISPSAAAARIAMTTRFTQDWLAPDSTAARLGNPTLLLVKDDKVTVRVNLHVDGYAYDPEENIARLTEALRLADGDGEADNYVATTTRTLSDGETRTAAFQINDRTECFRIKDAKPGVWRFSVTNSTADVDVAVSVCTGGVAVASGVGTATVELTAAMLAANPCLRLVAYPDEAEKVCTARGASAFTASATCAMLAPPTETDPHKLNPFLGKKRAKQTMPLMASIGDKELLAGTLTVSIASRNKISAKFVGAAAKTYSFSGTWQDQDAANGKLTATMEKKDARLQLSLAADGTLEAKAFISGSAMYIGDGSTVEMSGEVGLPTASGSFARYSGRYTVQLPAVSCEPEGLLMGGIALTLDMTSALAVKSGKVKYNAVLPNGKAVTGTAFLSASHMVDESGAVKECAVLPVFSRVSRQIFGAVLRIKPDGAGTWESPHDADGLNVVGVEDGTIAYCVSQGKVDSLSVHEAYGSWFRAGSTLADLRGRFELSDTFSMVFGEVAGSERYGAVVEGPSATLRIAGKKLSVVNQSGAVKIASYAAKTGMIKGKCKIRFEGRVCSGQFACVVLPGWIDCHCVEGFIERPFAAGTLWFADYVKRAGRWTSVVRSVPVEIQASQP